MTGAEARSWTGAGMAAGARPTAADESDSIGEGKGDDRSLNEGFDKNLHTTTKTENQMKSRFF